MKFSRQQGSPTRATLTAFGFAILLTVTIAFNDRSGRKGQIHGISPPASEKALASRRVRLDWYIRKGQWMADVRTVLSAVRYWLEPQADSNPIGQVPSLELAMPTNSMVIAPRA